MKDTRVGKMDVNKVVGVWKTRLDRGKRDEAACDHNSPPDVQGDVTFIVEFDMHINVDRMKCSQYLGCEYARPFSPCPTPLPPAGKYSMLCAGMRDSYCRLLWVCCLATASLLLMLAWTLGLTLNERSTGAT